MTIATATTIGIVKVIPLRVPARTPRRRRHRVHRMHCHAPCKRTGRLGANPLW